MLQHCDINSISSQFLLVIFHVHFFSLCVCVSVCLSCLLNCGKMADWIWMLFGVVCWVALRICSLDKRLGVLISPTGRGNLGMDMGWPIVTSEESVAFAL